MNERIKELAKQAGYRDIFDNDTKARARLEKYTELIVKECCHIMNTTAKKAEESNTYMGDDVPTRVHQYKIKQHFGVEE